MALAKTCLAGLFGVWLGLGAVTSRAQGAAVLAPGGGLEQARQRVEAARNDAAAVKAKADKACEEAAQASQELQQVANLPTLAQAQGLVVEARLKLCNDLRAASARAQDEVRKAEEVRRALEGPPPAVVVAVPVGVEDLNRMVADATKAQDLVEALRKKLVTVYDSVDAGTGAALALKEKDDVKSVTRAMQLQAGADAAREARHQAQLRANAFVKAALEIKACLLEKGDACSAEAAGAYQRAAAARSAMEEQIRLGESKLKEVNEIAAETVIAGQWDPSQRAAALAFARLLEKYPNAAAPFSKNGFILVASGKDKLASVKLGADRMLPNGWSNWALQFSTPLADTGPSRVFSFSDGMVGVPNIAISRTNLEFGKAFGSSSWLSTWAAELKAGYSNRSYYEDGETLNKTPVKKRVSPWDASVAYVAHEIGTSNSHLFRLAWQRRVDDNPAQTRCPVDSTGSAAFVDCVSGSFGPPKAKEGGIVTYQYRYQAPAGDFAASPTLSYNRRTGVTGFGLPLFLLREDQNKKSPFNAGIRADWVSKGRFEVTGNTSSTWTFGVFVGSSFNLLSRQE